MPVQMSMQLDKTLLPPNQISLRIDMKQRESWRTSSSTGLEPKPWRNEWSSCHTAAPGSGKWGPGLVRLRRRMLGWQAQGQCPLSSTTNRQTSTPQTNRQKQGGNRVSAVHPYHATPGTQLAALAPRFPDSGFMGLAGTAEEFCCMKL